MIAGLLWIRCKARIGRREESPDTTLRQQSVPFSCKASRYRATRLVTPGDAVRKSRVTDSATEKIPPVKRIPVIARRKTFGTSSNGTRHR